jgi:hypothetical protein
MLMRLHKQQQGSVSTALPTFNKSKWIGRQTKEQHLDAPAQQQQGSISTAVRTINKSIWNRCR